MKKIICGNTECKYCNPDLDKPLGRCSKDIIVLFPGNDIKNTGIVLECKSFRPIRKKRKIIKKVL